MTTTVACLSKAIHSNVQDRQVDGWTDELTDGQTNGRRSCFIVTARFARRRKMTKNITSL